MRKYTVNEIDFEGLEGKPLEGFEIIEQDHRENVVNHLPIYQKEDMAYIFRSLKDMNASIENGQDVDVAEVKANFVDFISKNLFPYDLIKFLPWKSQKSDLVFDIISPDGLSFWMDDMGLQTIEDAEKIFQEDVYSRFTHQGYYSTSNREQIDLDDLRLNCRFIQREPYEEEEEEEA